MTTRGTGYGVFRGLYLPRQQIELSASTGVSQASITAISIKIPHSCSFTIYSKLNFQMLSQESNLRTVLPFVKKDIAVFQHSSPFHNYNAWTRREGTVYLKFESVNRWLARPEVRRKMIQKQSAPLWPFSSHEACLIIHLHQPVRLEW